VHRLNTKTELRQIPTHRVQIYRLLVGAFAGGASPNAPFESGARARKFMAAAMP